MAVCFTDSKVLPQSSKEAIVLYPRKAAGQEDAQAQYGPGAMYAEGLGGSKSII